jgi:hypothetical protein
MDKGPRRRDTADMRAAGSLRHRIARTLNAAYGDGLLSESTFAHRLDVLFGSPLIEPDRLVGDLTFRSPRRGFPLDLRRTIATVKEAVGAAGRSSPTRPTLLALDWTGAQTEVLVGRHHACDVILEGLSVSRRHAQLRFRDGNWILRDLGSTNGTTVNGRRVVRCRLEPGDLVSLGDESLVVD